MCSYMNQEGNFQQYVVIVVWPFGRFFIASLAAACQSGNLQFYRKGTPPQVGPSNLTKAKNPRTLLNPLNVSVALI